MKPTQKLLAMLLALMLVFNVSGVTTIAADTSDAPSSVASEAAASTPDASSTEASESEANTPDASKPEASESEASTPDASKPEASESEASTPDASKPEASESEANTPDASKPCPNHLQHDVTCGYSPSTPCMHKCNECATLDSTAPVIPKPKIVIASFTALDPAVAIVEKPIGTKLEDLALPTELEAVTTEGKTIKLAGITWSSAPEYNPDVAGAYAFTAVLPNDYTLENDKVVLPVITVTLVSGELVFTAEPATTTLHTAPEVSSRGINSQLPADGFSSFSGQLTASSKTSYDILASSNMMLAIEIPITVNLTYPASSFQQKMQAYLDNTVYRDFFDALAALDRDKPEVFWLSNSQAVGAAYSGTPSGSNVICTKITLKFTPKLSDYNSSQINSVQSSLDSQIDNIVAAAGDNEFDQVKYFHDWLVTNNDYNPTVANGGTPATTKPWKLTSALLNDKDGGPVCEGYARAFKALCDAVDIPCALVSGFGGGGPHMWNYVKLDGAWYPVDTTWDDPIGGNGSPYYNYFLIDSQTFNSEHSNNGNFSNMSGTFSYPVLSSTAYNGNKIKPSGTATPSTTTMPYGDLLSTITLSGSFTDNGTSVPGTIAWQTPNQKLGKVGTYDVAWTFTPNDKEKYSNVNGKATITVTPRPVTLSLSGATSVVYNGLAQGLVATYTPIAGETANVKVTYNGSATKPVNAGSYAVVANVADSNYSAASQSATFTITPKPLTLSSSSLSIANGYTLVKKVPLSQFGISSDLFSKAAIGTITDTNSIFDGTPTIANNEISVKLKGEAEIGQKATIEVKLVDANYTVTSGILTVNVTKEGYHNTLLNAPKTVILGEDIILPTGFALKTEFDSGKPAETKTVTQSMLSGYDKAAIGADSVGKKVITVTVDKNRNATFEIEVLDAVVDLTVVPPTKLHYEWQANPQLDLAGGQVTPIMRSTLVKSPVAMSENMLSITSKTIGAVGNYTVDVTYMGKKKLQVFTVTVDALNDIKTDPADFENGKPGIAVELPKDAPEDIRLDLLQMRVTPDTNAEKENFASQLKTMAGFVSFEVELINKEGGSVDLPKGTKLTIQFPYPVGTTSAHSFKVLHQIGGTTKSESFTRNSKGIQVKVDSLSPFAIGYSSKPNYGSSSSTSTGTNYGTDYDGYDFWMDVNNQIENASSGSLIKVNAKGYDKVPWNVLETLRGKTNVTLQIDWYGSIITIPSGKVLPYDGYIYYPLSYLKDAYSGTQKGSSNFNPETGGVMEFTAPVEAENLPVTPKTRGKDISLDDAEKLDSIEKPAETIQLQNSVPVDEPSTTGKLNLGVVLAVVFALIPIAGGGVWFWYTKKKVK